MSSLSSTSSVRVDYLVPRHTDRVQVYKMDCRSVPSSAYSVANKAYVDSVASGVPQANVIYMAVSGSDSNDGTTLSNAVRTLDRAIYLANQVTATAYAGGICIYSQDAGLYVLTNPATISSVNCAIYAPRATMEIHGTLTVNYSTTIEFDKIYDPSSSHSIAINAAGVSAAYDSGHIRANNSITNLTISVTNANLNLTPYHVITNYLGHVRFSFANAIGTVVVSALHALSGGITIADDDGIPPPSGLTHAFDLFYNVNSVDITDIAFSSTSANRSAIHMSPERIFKITLINMLNGTLYLQGVRWSGLLSNTSSNAVYSAWGHMTTSKMVVNPPINDTYALVSSFGNLNCTHTRRDSFVDCNTQATTVPVTGNNVSDIVFTLAGIQDGSAIFLPVSGSVTYTDQVYCGASPQLATMTYNSANGATSGQITVTVHLTTPVTGPINVVLPPMSFLNMTAQL